MTEKTPAPAEQPLPSRRARRAAQNSEGSGAAVDEARERLKSPVPPAGPADAPGPAETPDGGQPMTRRRARAELRSWGTAAPVQEYAEVLPQGKQPVLLIEQEPEHRGSELEEPGPEESGQPEESGHPAGLDIEPDGELQPAPEPTAETEGGPAQVLVPETLEDQPGTQSAPEAAAPVLEPESAAGQETGTELEAGARLETGTELEAGTEKKRAVVLPELPVAPPAASVQETKNAAADDAVPNGNETAIEPETAQPAQALSPVAAGREPEQREPHPSGLPLEPALMPSDLRERTRLAVRGEPNDVRRATFLDTQTAKIPATRGFRGFLASLGIRVAPSARELDERQDTRTVSQHWPGPRTISVVNGKGGANKTPTTVMLAAIFARNGGGPVLAWDNNETRGTLGWRTEQAQHDATVMDLMPETGLLLSPAAQSAMLARFVHHQTDDKYDVLRSNPNVLASEQKVTRADFDALHSVASKYFRLNIVDSGNDESAERWLRMIDHTDQLVIATTTVEEHAEAGALLLEALQERGGRYAELARGAVVIVSQADRNGTEAQARRVAEAFKVLARAAVTIPYDPALVKGQIRYASLRPATQRAWLKAAAAVAGGL